MNRLVLDRQRLRDVIDAPDVSASQGAGEGAVVSMSVIAECHRPECHCQDEAFMTARGLPTLEPGIAVADLHTLESGCHVGYICPSLDAVRRRYGK